MNIATFDFDLIFSTIGCYVIIWLIIIINASGLLIDFLTTRIFLVEKSLTFGTPLTVDCFPWSVLWITTLITFKVLTGSEQNPTGSEFTFVIFAFALSFSSVDWFVTFLTFEFTLWSSKEVICTFPFTIWICQWLTDICSDRCSCGCGRSRGGCSRSCSGGCGGSCCRPAIAIILVRLLIENPIAWIFCNNQLLKIKIQFTFLKNHMIYNQ